ncbi:hypothetical protein AMTRI_Chr13g86130 [Amborella trichopoda]
MKNITDSFISLGHWPSTGSFRFNTNIFATNLNLSVVLGVLIFFRKGSVYELFISRRGWILPATLYSFSFILELYILFLYYAITIK